MGGRISLRQDFDAGMLRGLAKQSKDANQTRRLLALASIYDGCKRLEAARIGGVTLQIVRDWVLRFNAEGRHDTKEQDLSGFWKHSKNLTAEGVRFGRAFLGNCATGNLPLILE